MSGGGVTPFSPTPWLFDTGDTPLSMGQNCVAGTTEYDEENGIGLVMYVESGNNMIVWKMSDGTKQGTTIPVSSDYQKMLRSAFENKTGTTIGYFILHPYTEETIDIESSITINSGETPSQKIAAKINGSDDDNYFIIGTLSGEDFEIITNGKESCIAKSNGVINNFSGPPASAADYLKGKLQSVGITVTSISEKVVSWEVGSTIPNWSEYTQYT